jgi:diacylglycerol O-acyltransferase / wax synthase
MNREQFSNADHALLRFDSPTNWMINTALIIFETRLTVDELLAVFQRSMLAHYRFQQKVVRPYHSSGKAYWEDDDRFDLRHHISLIRTSLPGEPRYIKDIISKLMSVGLNPTIPLWQSYLIENYGNGSALILRVHHSIADGASLVNVLLSMTQMQPGLVPVEAPAAQNGHKKRSNPNGQGESPRTMQFVGKLIETGLEIFSDVESVRDSIRLGSSAVNSIMEIVFNPMEPANNFRGRVGSAKLATWSPEISLERVKEIGKSYNSTINDVLLCAVTGALREYILQLDENNPPPEIHTLVPVDMRREYRVAELRSLTGMTPQNELGNQVGATLLKLPLDIVDPVQRLEIIHQSMDLLKASGEAIATYGLVGFLGAVPAEVQDLATRFWFSKSSAVMTNVVGPNKKLYMANAPIDTLIGWVPMFGPLGLGVSIFSYDKKVWIGVAVDQGLIPDPEIIISKILLELDKLAEQAQI